MASSRKLMFTRRSNLLTLIKLGSCFFACCALFSASGDGEVANEAKQDAAFYERHPNLKNYKSHVDIAFQQLLQSGYRASSASEAEQAVVERAYVSGKPMVASL